MASRKGYALFYRPTGSEFWHWLRPGMKVKRYLFVAFIGLLVMFVGVAQFQWGEGPLVVQLFHLVRSTALPLPPWLSASVWMLAGLLIIITGLRLMNRSLISAIADPATVPRQVYLKRRLEAGPRIVAMGGGTGLSRVLRGLKTETANITGIVAVTDDGGSTGRLRSSFGVPAVGDLVDCLAALSEVEGLAELMEYRFKRGGELTGHTFGNLMLVSLSEVSPDFAEALRRANQVLRLHGAVWPATPEAAVLWAEREDGSRVKGESALREQAGYLKKVGLNPANVEAMPEAVQAIQRADLIVLGPGSLFSSVIPSFLPLTIQKTIQKSTARLVYIPNIMSERGETDGMDAYAHYKAVITHLGRRPDVIILNTAPIGPALLSRYKSEGQVPVALDYSRFKTEGTRVVQGDFLETGFAQHDPAKLVKALIELC
jgi:uncharacterized cofD-like protein